VVGARSGFHDESDKSSEKCSEENNDDCATHNDAP